MGLEPFVVGLIEDIFNMFGQVCSVEIMKDVENETSNLKVAYGGHDEN